MINPPLMGGLDDGSGCMYGFCSDTHQSFAVRAGLAAGDKMDYLCVSLREVKVAIVVVA